MSDDFFTPPAFKPAEALLNLQRQLRELRPLSARADQFELQGVSVLQLQSHDDHVLVRLARRRSRQTEWDTVQVRNAAELRKLMDDIKRRLLRWTDED